MRYGVVAREEAHLERRFGDAYRDYKARAPLAVAVEQKVRAAHGSLARGPAISVMRSTQSMRLLRRSAFHESFGLTTVSHSSLHQPPVTRVERFAIALATRAATRSLWEFHDQRSLREQRKQLAVNLEPV
jgi:hypothetical protein